MEILYLENCPSTHKYLIEILKTNPEIIAVQANNQSDGIGSRGNSWTGLSGNLFLSMALNKLPEDLNLASLSIYIAMIAKQILNKKGSLVWVKWPNDLYIDDKKVGGVISSKIGDVVVASIGINLLNAPNGASKLDIECNAKNLAKEIIKEVLNMPSWKSIFSNFKIEFEKSQNFRVHIDGKEVFLSDAKLCNDGSILLNNKKVYSLR